jgi:tyrosine-protein phosphatase SIW14
MTTQKLQKGLAVLALAFSLPAWSAQVEAPGIPNFHQVNERVYRGGQPAPEGWQSLSKLGVKTVIDLRREDEHSTAAEAKAVAAAGLNYVNVPMKGVVAPTNEQMAKIFALLNSDEPVFVHCKRGADRTGVVIAAYRIAKDGWERPKALSEAKALGMAWTQFGIKSYINSFQPKMLWAAAGLEPDAGSGTPLKPAVSQP